jgi:hypothetical protein
VALTLRRSVAVHLDLDIQGHTNLVFSIAAAAGNRMIDEQLNFSVDGPWSQPSSSTRGERGCTRS